MEIITTDRTKAHTFFKLTPSFQALLPSLFPLSQAALCPVCSTRSLPNYKGVCFLQATTPALHHHPEQKTAVILSITISILGYTAQMSSVRLGMLQGTRWTLWFDLWLWVWLKLLLLLITWEGSVCSVLKSLSIFYWSFSKTNTVLEKQCLRCFPRAQFHGSSWMPHLNSSEESISWSKKKLLNVIVFTAKVYLPTMTAALPTSVVERYCNLRNQTIL